MATSPQQHLVKNAANMALLEKKTQEVKVFILLCVTPHWEEVEVI